MILSNTVSSKLFNDKPMERCKKYGIMKKGKCDSLFFIFYIGKKNINLILTDTIVIF